MQTGQIRLKGEKPRRTAAMFFSHCSGRREELPDESRRTRPGRALRFAQGLVFEQRLASLDKDLHLATSGPSHSFGDH